MPIPYMLFILTVICFASVQSQSAEEKKIESRSSEAEVSKSTFRSVDKDDTTLPFSKTATEEDIRDYILKEKSKPVKITGKGEVGGIPYCEAVYREYLLQDMEIVLKGLEVFSPKLANIFEAGIYTQMYYSFYSGVLPKPPIKPPVEGSQTSTPVGLLTADSEIMVLKKAEHLPKAKQITMGEVEVGDRVKSTTRFIQPFKVFENFHKVCWAKVTKVDTAQAKEDELMCLSYVPPIPPGQVPDPKFIKGTSNMCMRMRAKGEEWATWTVAKCGDQETHNKWVEHHTQNVEGMEGACKFAWVSPVTGLPKSIKEQVIKQGTASTETTQGFDVIGLEVEWTGSFLAGQHGSEVEFLDLKNLD